MARTRRQRRIVCIDVEPGGRWTNFGAIGLCEIHPGGRLGTSTLVSFPSPLFPGNDIADFAGIWQQLVPQLTDAVLLAFNSRYDRSALRRMLQAASLETSTADHLRCVLLAARRTTGIPQLLSLSDAVHQLALFTPDEIEHRRRRFFDEGYGNKWTLNDAADDALACARLAQNLLATTGEDPERLFPLVGQARRT